MRADADRRLGHVDRHQAAGAGRDPVPPAGHARADLRGDAASRSRSGIVLGIARRRAGRAGRRTRWSRLSTLVGVSLPAFFLGLILQVVFFRDLDLLPLTGRVDPRPAVLAPDHVDHRLLRRRRAASTGQLAGAARRRCWHLVLPALTLAAYPIGLIARMTRASMLETHEPRPRPDGAGLRHRRAARSSAAWRCATRCCRCSTVIGLTLAYSLTGTFFVEVVFNWPGLGTFAVKGILNVDYPAIMGITLFGAAFYVRDQPASSTSCRRGSTRASGWPDGRRRRRPSATRSCAPGASCALTARRCRRRSAGRDRAGDHRAAASILAAVRPCSSRHTRRQRRGQSSTSPSACCRPARRTCSAPTSWVATSSAGSSWAPGPALVVSLLVVGDRGAGRGAAGRDRGLPARPHRRP